MKARPRLVVADLRVDILFAVAVIRADEGWRSEEEEEGEGCLLIGQESAHFPPFKDVCQLFL